MSDETRRLPGGEIARVDETPQGASSPTPTTYLPPVNGNGQEIAQRQEQPRPAGYEVPHTAQAKNSPVSMIALGLIGVGLFLLFGTQGIRGELFGSAIPLALGLIFLYVYQQNREYGFLIPGAILTGLGSGIVLTVLMPGGAGGFVPIGLGLGFISLWLHNRTHWWWLIPGSIVSLAGLAAVADEGFAFHGNFYLPFLLIAAGAFFLMQRQPKRKY